MDAFLFIEQKRKSLNMKKYLRVQRFIFIHIKDETELKILMGG